MAVKNKKSQKNILVIAAVVALTAVISVAIFALYNKNSSQTNPAESKDPASADNAVENPSQAITDGQAPSEDKVITPSNSHTQNNSPLEAPRLMRLEQAGDSIRVSATFSTASSGRCIVNFEKEGQESFSASAAIIVAPSYYTCNGFKINTSSLSSPGEWEVYVTHSLDGQTATSERRKLSIE